MWWIALWSVVTMIGAAGTLASINNVRFARRVANEVRQLTARGGGVAPLAPPSALPPPVQRYLAKAIGAQPRAIARARLHHAGSFRPSLDGSWLPIRGEQTFTTDPPGFIWWGRVRIAPGVWIDARDRSVDGVGNMLVMAESTVTLADSRGPELDQGALMRALGELTWFPTSFRDARYVRWQAVDDRRARATLTVNGRSVTGEFEFGADDLPAAFTASRYRDVGGGASVLTPFVGRSSDFRRVDGVLVPHRMVAAWIVDGRAVEYVDFVVGHIGFDWSGS